MSAGDEADALRLALIGWFGTGAAWVGWYETEGAATGAAVHLGSKSREGTLISSAFGGGLRFPGR